MKLSSKLLQPYSEVGNLILEILCTSFNERILKHLPNYTCFQYGERIPGKSYRERGDGNRIDNFKVVQTMMLIYKKLINTYIKDKSRGVMDRDNMTLPYHEKMLEVLKPWSQCLNLDVASRVDSLSTDQFDEILYLLSETEKEVARVYMNRGLLDISDNCCKRALFYARGYKKEGDKKVTLLLIVFTQYRTLRIFQDDLAGAVAFAEEAYNCAAIAYNPVHPQVQEAAGELIDCLIRKGDFSKAELFSKVTLDSLKDPANKVNQESEAVAKGYYNLALAICKQNGDPVRAEMLTRQSLRIRAGLNQKNHLYIAESADLLAKILFSQGDMGDEVKELYERCVNLYVKHLGPNEKNNSIAHTLLGEFYHKLAKTDLASNRRKEYLRLSESCHKESFRICQKRYGSVHQATINAAERLLTILELLES
jgi:tetratricopeptide (TPR) repeat protein